MSDHAANSWDNDWQSSPRRDTSPAPDVIPPAISIVSPAPNSQIRKHTAIVFRITDSGGFRRALPAVRYADSDFAAHYEIIHDGENFTTNFIGSTRTPIANGWEYTVRRSGGWLLTPTLVPFAFDLAGNEPS